MLNLYSITFIFLTPFFASFSLLKF
jgi:hypothetical protein